MAKIDTCQHSDAPIRSRWELECKCLWAQSVEAPKPIVEAAAWTTIDVCAKCRLWEKRA